MPITEAEWHAGTTTDAETGDPATTPVGENPDNAYTRAEVIKGVDFGETEDPDRVSRRLGGVSIVTENLVDIAGDITASVSSLTT